MQSHCGISRNAVQTLHPSTSLEWEEWPSLPVKMSGACSEYLNGTLYFGGGSILTLTDGFGADAALYSFKPGVDSTWTVTDTPTYWYTLVVHDSELLLVGGYEYHTHDITNKVFTMRDGQFVETLPPMIESRESASAVSDGSALVVAGGCDTSGELSSVEVFKDGQWTTVPSLPSAGSVMQSALHGDQWYLITYQGKIFCVSLLLLISGSDQSSWETLPDAPNSCSAAAFFGGCLLSIGGGDNRNPTTAIYALSSSTQSWVHAADLPLSLGLPTSSEQAGQHLPVLGLTAAVVLSSEQLVVSSSCSVLHGKLIVTPFDADSHFTVRAIDRLKASAGISLIEELVQHTPTAFPAVAGLDVREMYDHILREWASRCGSRPPTWTELFRALKEMGLRELAGRMEKYFRGSVPEDPPIPPFDKEGDSEEEKDEQEILRLNSVLAEYISANTVLQKEITQLKKANNPEQEIASLKVKEEQVANKEEPTSGNVNEEPVSQLQPSNSQHHVIPFNLPGVEVVASTCVIVTNSPQTFHWVGYGFKLTIPQGSLPAGVGQCRLDIKASVAGQYQFPGNLQLVSGVFWIRPHPLFRFQQQLTIEIQHCAKITSSTKLSFVRACCSQKHLPYTFEVVDSHASFSKHSSYGVLEINHFSGYGNTVEITDKRHYIASLYYFEVSSSISRIHFVVTWNTDIHSEAVSRQYKKKRAVLEQYSALEFEEDRISLDVNDIVTTSGWKIMALATPLIITKSEVDDYTGRSHWIPTLQLQANRLKTMAKLECTLKLNGTKRPKQLNILIDFEDSHTSENIREDDERGC
ncbi:uncharacterized protein LOC135347836 isoform X2 [Halichondria panicea]|uniref:uncharacterized protein LOC135347836 isoform X2 n=1 Tax=Halichondria panicea TaxID=6063 RepID=UPI00312B9E03